MEYNLLILISCEYYIVWVEFLNNLQKQKTYDIIKDVKKYTNTNTKIQPKCLLNIVKIRILIFLNLE